MTLGWIVIAAGCLSFFLALWGQKKMQKALNALNNINETVQINAKGMAAMGCKCQEKKKDSSIPCPDDPLEESFRTAFMAETKKTSRLSAEKQELQVRLELQEKAAVEALRRLELKVQGLEHYAKYAFDALPATEKQEFQKMFGAPAISLRISNGV